MNQTENKNTSNGDQVFAENKMGVMPVKKLILTMSLPMMISMLVQALYNIVDSIFVARLSEDALTAVTLAFPMQNLMIAMGSGTGVGINALLSRSLGKKDYEEASNAANTGIFLNFVNYVIFALLGLFAVRPFIHSQT
ncbi:MAG: MATE family efflux transporter, partial [Lachnospiraceae bacterium]|nr:MATE family efflux transporter [Lachnospiraceae bacterium]